MAFVRRKIADDTQLHLGLQHLITIANIAEKFHSVLFTVSLTVVTWPRIKVK